MKTVIAGGTIVVSDEAGSLIEGDLVIDGTAIVAIEPRYPALRRQSSPPRRQADSRPVRLVDATGCVVIPGLIQAHVHLCQVLMRGMADDLPLLQWLKQRIWPFEAAHDHASLQASSELGLVEMMRAGTTTILDMGTVHHHDAVMDACVRSGIRAFSGKAMMDVGEGVPKGLRETTKWSLSESDRLAKTWTGKGDGRIGYAYAPRFILASSEKLFREVALRSGQNGARLHSHAAEHPDEQKAVRAIFGKDDVDVLDSWGFSGPNTLLAHGVQLTRTQAKRMAKDGTRIVHCPSANLKLGSGIAAIAMLLDAGMILGIGADGAPCNNNLDPWTELRHAALLAKVRTGITTMPAKRTFELATRLGAQALGIGDKVGTLEVGKLADIAVVRMGGAHMEPGGDVYSRLVYAAKSTDVEHVWVNGKHLVRHGEHQIFDHDAVVQTARIQARHLRARADV